MRKLLIAGAALMALIGTSALAADMPLKAPPAPVAPAWSWTGFYGGINGGYGWNRSTGDEYAINPAGVLFGAGTDSGVAGVVRPRGGLFGGQAGYNWQSQSIVYGLEADIQWSGIKGSGSGIDPCCNGAPGAPGLFTANANLQWFGTARGRIGVLASPNTLLYVTGGLIYGRRICVQRSDICRGAALYLSGRCIFYARRRHGWWWNRICLHPQLLRQGRRSLV